MDKLLYGMLYAACRIKIFHSFLVGLCESENNMLREAAYNATVNYTLRKEV